jgi:hypothetical protein
VSPAGGLLLLLAALWVFVRTVRGQPRLANVILKGRQAAVSAGGTG